MEANKFQDCVDACLRCAAMCQRCVTACLDEEDVNAMAGCIRQDLECAALCSLSAQLMGMGSAFARELCSMCAKACEDCATICGQHEAQHCKDCAEACRICAAECLKMA